MGEEAPGLQPQGVGGGVYAGTSLRLPVLAAGGDAQKAEVA